MLRWPLIFLAVALAAAIAGFGGLATDAGAAQGLFLLCIAAFAVMLVRGAGRVR